LDVVEAGELAEAELAYQRALAALHEARSELSDLSAARRRFAFDRLRLAPEVAAARAAELESAHAALTVRAGTLREQAAILRAELRRLTDDAAAEPDDPAEEPAAEGFQQPPFEPKP
jgi:hypothetical protein